MHAAILIKNQLKANVGKRHSKTVPVHLKGVEIKIDNYSYMSFYDKINKKNSYLRKGKYDILTFYRTFPLIWSQSSYVDSILSCLKS